jgi:predicted ATPase/DNA-binding CsgD family transcriptional regulator
MRNLEPNATEVLAEPLTRREYEILNLLAQDYSGPEIAQRLTLAPSSVKWHILGIYGKLGVNRRQRALRRAAELGLLDSPLPTPKIQPGDTAKRADGGELPLTTSPGPRHNLPFGLTRFFGREVESERLKSLLAEHRLVTLSGPGGVGKTRLSLQVAEGALGEYSNGVWLVELAALSDPALVAQSVAAALGVGEESGRPMEEILTVWLSQRQLMLVLDNCEHLLGECARLADHWLRASSQLSILATSREPLGIAGEAVFSVQSLPFPDPECMPPIDRLNGYAALTLLVDRARLVVADYQITPRQAVALARICQRLNGIPLAIELAAARLNMLTAAELADRLDDAFSLLTAAEAVCSGDGLEPRVVLGVLTALVAKSMVITDRRQGAASRYSLLETVRQYALEKLQEAGQATHFQTRHRDFFQSFVETNIAKLDTLDRPMWNRRLMAELANFRQAVEWSFNDPSDVEAGPRLVMVITSRPIPCHSHREQLDWHMRSLALCDSGADISAQLHIQLLERASGLVALNDPETALGLSNRAIEICRGLGPDGKETLMWTLYGMAWDFAPHIAQVDQILAPLAEAEAILHAFGPGSYAPEMWLKHQAKFATLRAEIAICQGRYSDAKVHAGEGIRLFEEGGSLWGQAEPLTRLGIACYYLGEYQEARDHLMIALGMTRAVHSWEVSYNLRWLAATDSATGNLERALDYCLESIRLANELPDRNIVASSLGVLAAIRARQGHADCAARLAGASAAMWAKQKRKPWEDSSLDTLLPGRRDGPDQMAVSKAFADGQVLTSEQAVAQALGESTDP